MSVQEIVQMSHEQLTVGRSISAIVACVVTWSLILFLYGYKNSGNGFRPSQYVIEKKDKFIMGLVITVAIAVLKLTNQNFEQLLAMLGFRPGPSAAVSIGLGIAAFLLSIGKKNLKPEDNQP